MNFDVLLKKMVELQASDMFITANKPPCVKTHGLLVNLADTILTPEKSRAMVLNLMNEKQQQEFLARKEYNFAIDTQVAGRFRVSAFFERFHVGAVLRKINDKIPLLADLDVPPVLADLSLERRGLVIIAGGTGTGKSTTLAAMINHRNMHSNSHIVTIEDPIEFIHKHDKSIITQREVGLDTDSYEIALKNVLRQAPDLIMLGEIRSAEAMEYALQFSETGHLCLATLHANNTVQALDRIISFFPSTKHQQLWLELYLSLRGVVSQQLITNADRSGRVLATEVLLNTSSIREHIRHGDLDLIKDLIKKGNNVGMYTFDQSLFKLYKAGKISEAEALHNADSENDVRLMIKFNGDVDMNAGSLQNAKLQE